jgi:hypothetical protein
MTARTRAQGEAGVSLVLALIFLASVGLLIPAIARLGSTDAVGTVQLQGQRRDAYAADGAVDAAIQYLRNHHGCGRTFPSCPIADNANFYGATINGSDVEVALTADPKPFNLDRDVTLIASVDGKPRVSAEVIVRDSSGKALPSVDVKSWAYLR